MTREEAIIELKDMIDYEWGTYQTKTAKIYVKALNMAIKTLEQEPFINKPCVSTGVCEHDKQKVLDKIRAEIDKARFIDKDTRIVKNANASGLEVAMQIIDKYKAGK